MSALRHLPLYIARGLGAFRLARHLTRRRLRILCYHGFSAGDEHEVMPHMFMRAATFERRLRILKKRRLAVIPLAEAVHRLARGEIHSGETVITLDDGWASNLTIAAPILERYGYPACIYVTTEHLAAGTEVFNVALLYMLHKCGRASLQLAGVHPLLDGDYDLRPGPVGAQRAIMTAAEKAAPTPHERQQLLRAIATALDMDLGAVLSRARFRLLDPGEMRELAARGFDIELHTHRHRLPDDSFDSVAAEIADNRAALRTVLGRESRHFCYPSGKYGLRHPEWLARLGIASATTCDPGMNDWGAPPLLLKRFIDGDHFADIVFDAEVCGFRELMRSMRRALR
jgi:peptidoglycan/xylan/chitin deacetylase (PgdA/CDA1 family)